MSADEIQSFRMLISFTMKLENTSLDFFYFPPRLCALVGTGYNFSVNHD